MAPLSLTSTQFVFSGESLLLGPIFALLVQALVAAHSLFARRRSLFYGAFIVLVLLRLLDVILNFYFSSLDEETFYSVYFLQIIVEWIAGNILPILNLTRLHAVCMRSKPNTVRALAVCTAACLCLHNISCIWYLVNLASGSSLKGNDLIYAAWSCCDAIVNTSISIVFVMFLESVVGKAHSNQKSLHRTLYNVKFLLASDVAIIVASDVLQLAAPTVDPLWIVYFFAEAYRVCMLSRFLILLNQIMQRKQPVPSALISSHIGGKVPISRTVSRR
ncbi:hypothetical protein BC828DRAFT_380498 [Blastocladiella britannica]|nr:hypothetical protein BC828DRAFT_380498 [Blastocladiella britannica]